MTSRNIDIPKMYHWMMGICALIIGAYSKWILIGLIPLLITIYIGHKKNHFTWKWHPLAWTWGLLYIIYLVYSLVFYDDTITAQQIEYKLSWIIFPVIFSLQPKFHWKINSVINGFAIGIFIASLLGIAKAIQTCITIGVTLTSFTSSNITINHPTYFSASASILLIILLTKWNKPSLNQWPNNLKWITLIFTTLMVLLSFSMAGFLFLGISIGMLIIIWAIKSKIKLYFKTIAIAFPILFVIMALQHDFIKGEFQNTFNSAYNYLKDPSEFISSKKDSQTGDEVRLIMWTATFLESSEHPFGVGPTKIGSHLSERLYSLNQPSMAELNKKGEVHYNPHNQFLQMSLEIGWIPLLFFLMMLIKFIAHGISKSEYALSLITVLLGFHCLFESILQRQSGIVTFTFFIGLFLFRTIYTNDQKQNVE